MTVSKLEWVVFFLVLALSGAIPGAAGAMRRSFVGADGRGISFEGALDMANPLFIRGFVAQQDAVGPRGRALHLRVWLGRRTGQTGDVSIGGQVVRGAHLFQWVKVPADDSTVVADMPSSEGQATQGFACGFAVNFMNMPPSMRPRAGDVIWVYLARDAQGTPRQGWRLFEYRLGWEETNPYTQQANSTGGAVNATDPFRPALEAASGQAYYRGEIVDIRRDRVRGYAYDELAMYRDVYMANGPGGLYTTQENLTVQVLVYRKPYDSGHGSWGDPVYRSEPIIARERRATPLAHLDSRFAGSSAGTWDYGWTCALNQPLEAGNRYQFEVIVAPGSGATRRWGIDRAGRVLDRRTLAIPPSTRADRPNQAMLVSHEIIGGDGQPVRELRMRGDGGGSLTEKLTTRAFLYPEELVRFQPGTGWKHRPDMLADGFNQSLAEFAGSTSGIFVRESLPQTREGADGARIALGGRVSGGIQYRETYEEWQRLQGRRDIDQADLFSGRVFVYSWSFPEVHYQVEAQTALQSGPGGVTGATRAQRIEAIFQEVQRLAGEKRGELERAAGRGVPMVIRLGSRLEIPFRESTRPGGPRGYQAIPWSELDGAQRASMQSLQRDVLDPEFNRGTVEVGFGLVNTITLARLTTAAESGSSLPTPVSASDVSDAARSSVPFVLHGDYDRGPSISSDYLNSREPGDSPLHVSARYLHERACRIVDNVLNNRLSPGGGTTPGGPTPPPGPTPTPTPTPTPPPSSDGVRVMSFLGWSPAQAALRGRAMELLTAEAREEIARKPGHFRFTQVPVGNGVYEIRAERWLGYSQWLRLRSGWGPAPAYTTRYRGE